MSLASLTAALEEQDRTVNHIDINHIATHDGKLFVEFWNSRSSSTPGIVLAGEHDCKLLGELDTEAAAEHGAEEGCKMAIFAEEEDA